MSAIFFGGDPKAIVRAAVSKQVELVATKAVLAEYHEVAERLHGHYPVVSFRRPLAILESIVKLVRPATLAGAVCRDPDDDAFIACALGGKAKIICSGDDDLLAALAAHGKDFDRATLNAMLDKLAVSPEPDIKMRVFRGSPLASDPVCEPACPPCRLIG